MESSTSEAEQKNRERNLSLISTDEDVRNMFRATDIAAAERGQPTPQTFEQWDRQANETLNTAPEEWAQRVISGDYDAADPVQQRLAKMVMDRNKSEAGRDRVGVSRPLVHVGKIETVTEHNSVRVGVHGGGLASVRWGH
jgi:hypothetical protein